MLRYPAVAIALHWLIAAALIFEIGLGWRIDEAPGEQAFDVMRLHQSIGITVLLLTLLRIGWRWIHPFPQVSGSVSIWERRAARITHLGFYILLLGLPLSGWALSSSGADSALRLYGLLPWPLFPGAGPMESAADFTHHTLVNVAYVLVALHVLGALKHHFVDRSLDLGRMLPGVRRMLDWRLGALTLAVVAVALTAVGFTERQLGLVKPAEAVSIDPRRTAIFAGLIQPVFEAKCFACHSERKVKGGLRLDSFAAVTKGGEGGKGIVAGSAASSELVRRILLPAHHKEAMPPRGKSPVSFGEGELIRWWIDTGAQEKTTIAVARKSPTIDKILEAMGADASSTWMARKAPPAAAADLEKAADAGYRVKPVAASSGLLDAVQVRAGSAAAPISAAPLVPLRTQIVWLDFSYSRLSDESWNELGKLGHLTRLTLAGTNVGDEALRAFAPALRELESLNLYGTAVTDSALRVLARMPMLSTVYLSETAVSAEGVEALRKSRPELKVIWQATQQIRPG